MKQEEKRPYGGAFPSEPKPNCCCVCGDENVVAFTKSIFGQILGGLCETHKDWTFTMSFGDRGISDGAEMNVSPPIK